MKNLAICLFLFSIVNECAAQKTTYVSETSGSRFNKITIGYHVLANDKSVKHGSYDIIRNSGGAMLEGFYKMNKKDSVWKRYDSKGGLLSEVTYAEGNKTGKWIFYDGRGGKEWQYDFGSKSGDYPKFRQLSYTYQNENGEWVKEKTEIEPYWLSSSFDWQMFLNRTLRYPQQAIDKNIQGTPVIEVTVDENGNTIEYGIAESAHPLLDNEAMRAIKLYEPEFVPAEKNGKKVKVKFKIPIVFKLSN
jgi:TonB family protein